MTQRPDALYIEQAQKEIAEDWIATYRKYLGEPFQE